MKRVHIFFISLIFLFFGAHGGLNGQAIATASASGDIFAEIIPVFSASETAQMNFGKFSPGPQGGEIILSPQNYVSVLGSVYAGTGLHSAASFYISGDVDAIYSISLPSDPVLITNTRSAQTMRVENWLSTPAPGIGTGQLLNGFQVVNVGATLKVGTLHDNPVGIYMGSYTVTFDFN
ncbi:MAG: DUF4402 domain-containing protein [Bacteroides sp.]|nr:DUF4402 domain-containing protein [Bacteroides sp.]